ncbi:hypothetical protein GQ55_3G099200 [Panicum hallii var. hallii]|uniref:DUF3741 domain-containing protein n=1 Tax=Panicum hallii var. hallii TaxID=1504633 RepID=A0A2T7E7P1_9POAL|nr:hypothetical protein GQ55_3G099200 [Panicum hallii var. hallii]
MAVKEVKSKRTREQVRNFSLTPFFPTSLAFLPFRLPAACSLRFGPSLLPPPAFPPFPVQSTSSSSRSNHVFPNPRPVLAGITTRRVLGAARMAKLASSSGLALDFLRRLLCARGAGNADDPVAAAPRHLPTPETEPRSPCIVARLMGLDAMPAESPHAQPTPPLPLRRSRSASSAEGSPRPSPWDAQQQQPRVVRASASLREKPAYLMQESDEFLLLSFSPEGHRGRDVREELEFLLAAAEPTGRGEGTPDRAPKQRRNGYCRKLLFGDDEAGSSSGRRRRMPAAECDAQNSSPVSVLEVRDAQEEESTTTTSSSLEEVEHAEPCSATSDEVQTTLEQQNSRKLHADFDQFDNLSPPRSSCHASSKSSDRERNRRVVNKAEVIAPDVTGIWQPICRLVEEDLKNMKWSVHDGANVVAEMESGILDHLIREMVDEFVQGRSGTVHAFPLRSKKQLGCKNFRTRQAIGCY